MLVKLSYCRHFYNEQSPPDTLDPSNASIIALKLNFVVCGDIFDFPTESDIRQISILNGVFFNAKFARQVGVMFFSKIFWMIRCGVVREHMRFVYNFTRPQHSCSLCAVAVRLPRMPLCRGTGPGVYVWPSVEPMWASNTWDGRAMYWLWLIASMAMHSLAAWGPFIIIYGVAVSMHSPARPASIRYFVPYASRVDWQVFLGSIGTFLMQMTYTQSDLQVH